MLEEEPLFLLALHPHKCVRSLQFRPHKENPELPLFEASPHFCLRLFSVVKARLIFLIRCVNTGIPNNDLAGAISFRNNSFEVTVVDGMILHHHREPLVGRIQRRTLRHRPRFQDTV
jgi:hypothetical protein